MYFYCAEKCHVTMVCFNIDHNVCQFDLFNRQFNRTLSIGSKTPTLRLKVNVTLIKLLRLSTPFANLQYASSYRFTDLEYIFIK